MYSHAFDVVSNGGFNGFSGNLTNPENPYNVAQNYGPADYDIRNYISASYVINVPQYHKWGALTGNWTIGGTVFHSSGLPFTVTDSSIPVNYVGSLFAQQGCRSPQGVEAGTGFTRSVLWTVEENGDANAAGAFQNASAASTKTEMVCSASPMNSQLAA